MERESYRRQHLAMSERADDLAGLATYLRALFPEVGEIGLLRVLGDGFHSLAVETESGLVFRVGKIDDAMQGYAKETKLLPSLSPYLPLSAPNQHWHLGPSASFPYGVVGYRKVRGVPLDQTRLLQSDTSGVALALGVFLQALHAFPVPIALAAAVPGPDVHRQRLAQVRRDILSPLRAVMSHGEYTMVAAWWDDAVADPLLTPKAPVLCHGDFWHGNVLVDAADSTVTGIVDFEDANIGDSALDFAALRYLGDRFVTGVIRAYRAAGGAINATFARRVQRYWELREFSGLHYSVLHDDQAEFPDSLRKQRDGAVLNQAAHPLLSIPTS